MFASADELHNPVQTKVESGNRTMNDVSRDVNIAAVAELIGDPSRAAMLDALPGLERAALSPRRRIGRGIPRPPAPTRLDRERRG